MSLWAKTVIVALLSLLLRWCVSLNRYSGYKKPPMYGDYEAQRHWQEITLNLPATEWYTNSSSNDLLYWGLDYPSLTAYHSWLCGFLAEKINSDWVALGSSRGYESYEHKLFMRSTVLVADVLILLPAAIVLWMMSKKIGDREKVTGLLGLLLAPGLILIDYGHFQYNGVSLGLTVLAVALLAAGQDLVGAAAFCLALNYKQMELYHAMPFFCYLLGTCIRTVRYSVLKGVLRLLLLAMVVIITFTICWLPFLQSMDSVLAVIQRLFPFGRGLYEDKVANVWCSLSVVVKLKQLLDVKTLIYICLGSTAALILPSSLHLILRPSLHNFKLSLVNSSLVFFLFSFQVHEKSILLAAIPAALLVTDHLRGVVWFHIVSTFSMLPLLCKDGLLVPGVALTTLYTVVMYHAGSPSSPSKSDNLASRLGRFGVVLSCLGCGVLVVACQVVRPPDRYPDLHAVMVSVYSCVHFVAFLAYFHCCQFFPLRTLTPSPVAVGKTLLSKKNK